MYNSIVISQLNFHIQKKQEFIYTPFVKHKITNILGKRKVLIVKFMAE